ncbi:Tfiih basal transcription factor complex p44 subunit, partial [Daphnia magna]
SSKTSCVARFSQMRKSHLCPSWSAAAAASYGETIFFTLKIKLL